MLPHLVVCIKLTDTTELYSSCSFNTHTQTKRSVNFPARKQSLLISNKNPQKEFIFMTVTGFRPQRVSLPGWISFHMWFLRVIYLNLLQKSHSILFIVAHKIKLKDWFCWSENKPDTQHWRERGKVTDWAEDDHFMVVYPGVRQL